MSKKKLILFAGAVGSSKTPIATYLSWNLGLPIFSSDAIRSEVHEDTLNQKGFIEIYQDRRDTRLNKAIALNEVLILDLSIDRRYKSLKEKKEELDFESFIISLDLSREFLVSMYKAKGYMESIDRVDKLVAEHEQFCTDCGENVDLVINDKNFEDRLELSLEGVRSFLEK